MKTFRTLPLLLALLLPPCLAGAETTCVVEGVNEMRSSDAAQGELRLTLLFTDPRLADALEYGGWELSKAVDDKGVFLHPAEEGEDLFRPLRLRESTTPGAPPSAAMDLRLTVPDRHAAQIASIAGTVTVRTYRRQVVLVGGILGKTDQPLEDPLFEAHEISVRSVDPRQGIPGVADGKAAEALRRRAVSIRVEGDIDQVRGIELVDASNQVIPSRASEFGAGKTILFTRVADSDLPAETGVRILIPISPEEVRLPFSLQQIPLP